MPSANKADYSRAREASAKSKDSGGFFGNMGKSLDKGIGSVGKALGIGGNKDSSPTIYQRPKPRPEYVVTGEGKDKNYLNTKTGVTTPVPGYSPFSFKGLTSNDPGNVLRNQLAAKQYAAMPQRESRDRGIAALVSPTPTTPEAPVTTPSVTNPVAPAPETPLYVPTTGYDFNQTMFNSPMGYGSAFAGLSQPMANPYGGINLMDIFSMYPDLRYM
jgi:hypothetical protein